LNVLTVQDLQTEPLGELVLLSRNILEIDPNAKLTEPVQPQIGLTSTQRIEGATRARYWTFLITKLEIPCDAMAEPVAMIEKSVSTTPKLASSPRPESVCLKDRLVVLQPQLESWPCACLDRL
jgi:hypothetical protein